MEHYRQPKAKEVPCLQKLIDELLKDDPDKNLIRSTMKELGLSYAEDPIDCMNAVLKILHPEQSALLENGGTNK